MRGIDYDPRITNKEKNSLNTILCSHFTSKTDHKVDLDLIPKNKNNG